VTATRPSRSLLRRFGITLTAGLPGVLALAGWVFATTDPADVPAGLTTATYTLAAAVNPVVLLAVACALGAYTAPRVGLESYLVDRVEGGGAVWPRLRGDLPVAVGLGVAGSVTIVALDAAFAAVVGVDLTAAGLGTETLGSVLVYAPVRFLYGGITEELLLRYGLMSLFVFVGWRLLGARESGPSRVVVWVAIVASAVLFGVGHLPALAASVDLTPAVVARTVLLNAIGGVVFGWLYWRRSLEAAMVSHATFHVPLLALSLVQVV